MNPEKTSLFIFGAENPARIAIFGLVNNKIFELVILVLILATTVSLALESPLENPDSKMNMILEYVDMGMTAVFTIEMILKIVAYGLIINGKKSYLRVGWNILDFIVVVCSLTSYVFRST